MSPSPCGIRRETRFPACVRRFVHSDCGHKFRCITQATKRLQSRDRSASRFDIRICIQCAECQEKRLAKFCPDLRGPLLRKACSAYLTTLSAGLSTGNVDTSLHGFGVSKLIQRAAHRKHGWTKNRARIAALNTDTSACAITPRCQEKRVAKKWPNTLGALCHKACSANHTWVSSSLSTASVEITFDAQADAWIACDRTCRSRHRSQEKTLINFSPTLLQCLCRNASRVLFQKLSAGLSTGCVDNRNRVVKK